MRKIKQIFYCAYKTNAFYLNADVFSTKILIVGPPWSCEPLEGLAACIAKVVPYFFSYLKTLNIGSAVKIKYLFANTSPSVQIGLNNNLSASLYTLVSQEM